MADIFDSTDSQLVGAAATFVSVAQANSVILSLSPADLTLLTTVNTAYANGYNAMVTARDAAKAATQVKSNAKTALLNDLRLLARRFYANPAVPSNIIAALGLAVRDGQRTPVIPVPPAQVVAVGFANGVNKLRWKRNGNVRGVVFWIEESLDAVEWSLFGTTTRTTFAQEDQTPGQTKYYRIRATATDKVSAPSNEAVVYPNQGGMNLNMVQGGGQAAA